jgi:sugar-phosphatase
MKHMECDAIIFDLDGVLINSTAVVKRHWQQWAAQHHLDPEAIMCVAHGRRTVETIRLVAPHLDAMTEATSLAAGEAYDTEGLLHVDGAAELVDSLPSDAWAVATSGTRDTAITRLRYAGLPLPSVLVTAEGVERGKPAPQAFLRAATELRIAPEDCIVVEDAPAGIAAAHAAGMLVIAVATTHTLEDLQHADRVVAQLAAMQVLQGAKPSRTPQRPPKRFKVTIR